MKGLKERQNYIGQITMNIDRVNSGLECPYCHKDSEYVPDTEVYSRSYGGYIYLCRECDAYVGTHKPRPTESLGRLANKELRQAKIMAHDAFDRLWRKKIELGMKKGKARAKAYKWLSKEMNTAPELTHIGFFDVEQCKRVIDICTPYLVKS